jgi:hypothetical protein
METGWHYHKTDIKINGTELRVHVSTITDFQKEHQENSGGKEQSFQQMVLGQLNIYMQKTEVGYLPNSSYED